MVGGGVAGASAGISAARQGAKTLVLEYLHGLGGLGTLGMIGVYWDGFRGGYSAMLDKGVLEMAPADHPRRPEKNDRFPADWKMEWLRKELLKAGGELWFGTMGCGALSEGGQVKGLVVATPQGRGVLLSKIVIDSTGSADIAIAAGAGYEYTGKNTIAVQGAGTGKWAPGDYYNNNDWLFVDDTDVLDVSRAFVQAKNKSAQQFDLVKIPQTRERRRVVGDYTVSVYDVLSHRRYADTISYHKSSFDTHGMTIDPYFTLNPPEKRHKIYDADVPLRALLPKGLENILTTGLGVSAHRDAMPVIRMQPCLQNQGYAVGYLAALCVKEGKTPAYGHEAQFAFATGTIGKDKQSRSPSRLGKHLMPIWGERGGIHRRQCCPPGKGLGRRLALYGHGTVRHVHEQARCLGHGVGQCERPCLIGCNLGKGKASLSGGLFLALSCHIRGCGSDRQQGGCSHVGNVVDCSGSALPFAQGLCGGPEGGCA